MIANAFSDYIDFSLYRIRDFVPVQVFVKAIAFQHLESLLKFVGEFLLSELPQAINQNPEFCRIEVLFIDRSEPININQAAGSDDIINDTLRRRAIATPLRPEATRRSNSSTIRSVASIFCDSRWLPPFDRHRSKLETRNPNLILRSVGDPFRVPLFDSRNRTQGALQASDPGLE